MSDKILITGGTGYLGSHVLAALVENGYSVVLLKRKASSLKRISKHITAIKIYDIEDIEFKNVLYDNQISIIIHMAASYGRNGETLEDVAYANLNFPTRLLNAALEANVQYFINTSTSLPASVNDYSFTKNLFETCLKSKEKEINIINIIPEYFYGPGDDSWKLISMIIQKLIQKAPIIEFTDGLQQRDFIYITDVVNAFTVILSNIEKLKGYQSFSVSSGKTIRIRDMAKLCKEVCDNHETELAFGAIPNRNNDVLFSDSDNRSLQALGWTPQVDLAAGIKLTKEGFNLVN